MNTKPLASGESRWNDNGINVHAGAPEDGYYTLQLWSTPHFYAWYRLNGQIHNFPHGTAVWLPKGTWMEYRDTEVYYHPKIRKYRVFHTKNTNDFLDSLP